MGVLDGDYDGRAMYRVLQLEASATQEEIRQVGVGNNRATST
jgi:hypothetical protein